MSQKYQYTCTYILNKLDICIAYYNILSIKLVHGGFTIIIPIIIIIYY